MALPENATVPCASEANARVKSALKSNPSPSKKPELLLFSPQIIQINLFLISLRARGMIPNIAPTCEIHVKCNDLQGSNRSGGLFESRSVSKLQRASQFEVS